MVPKHVLVPYLAHGFIVNVQPSITSTTAVVIEYAVELAMHLLR